MDTPDGSVCIDGRYGEGGGSILRVAAGLSAVTGRSVVIENIRQNRPRPGLAQQHLTGLMALAKLFNAEADGLEIGSTRVAFAPRESSLSRLSIDVGTAGSIGLILQTLMIALPFAGRKVELEMTGGTHVPWAPNTDYLGNVTLQVLRQMGYEAEVDMLSPGYYPKGGGRVRATVEPVRRLEAIRLDDFGKLDWVRGISRASNLPRHISERQAASARRALEGVADPEMEISNQRALCPGTAITLWAGTSTGCRLGASSLGKRGKPAEEVGEEAAGELSSYIRSRSPVDVHLLDQILPYAALAHGHSTIRGGEFTMHAKTNIHVIRDFLDCEIKVEGEVGKPCAVEVEGAGVVGG